MLEVTGLCYSLHAVQGRLKNSPIAHVHLRRCMHCAAKSFQASLFLLYCSISVMITPIISWNTIGIIFEDLHVIMFKLSLLLNCLFFFLNTSPFQNSNFFFFFLIR